MPGIAPAGILCIIPARYGLYRKREYPPAIGGYSLLYALMSLKIELQAGKQIAAVHADLGDPAGVIELIIGADAVIIHDAPFAGCPYLHELVIGGTAWGHVKSLVRSFRCDEQVGVYIEEVIGTHRKAEHV